MLVFTMITAFYGISGALLSGDPQSLVLALAGIVGTVFCVRALRKLPLVEKKKQK